MAINANGQTTQIDSLKGRLKLAGNDNQKLKVTLELSALVANSDPISGWKYAEDAMQLANKIQSDTLLIKAKSSLATAYLQIGNYPRALQLYQEILKSKAANPNDILSTNMNIGIIYYYESNFATAISYYDKALYLVDKRKLEKDKKKTNLEGKLYNNLGIIYEVLKKFDKADLFYSKALDMSKQSNDQNSTAHVLINWGRLYSAQGKSDLTLRFYLQALNIRKKTNNNLGLTQCYISLGAFYFEQLKDYRTAETYLKQAIALGQHNGSWINVHLASEYLYKLYNQQAKYKEAFDALKLSKQVSDSLFNAQKTNKITELETQFQIDLKQKELEAKERERDLYYVLVAIGLGFSLVLVSLLFYLQRNKVKNSLLEQAHLRMEKSNLEKDIELKNKELTTNILYLMQKNELIEDICEKLVEIKGDVGEDSKQAVQKVIIHLQSNLSPELLQEFEVRFKQVHEAFFDALKKQFPSISPGERRLCAFLKLNMTTKEIATVTHQNIKSIEIARARLRKKLNLTGTDQNLINFLSQLG
ncbi:MAG: tetratricopeptide repeat protein [Mucilaginibacter sp.]|uniref:tetratricopeptide repeat protein n=1 Tax=Mucilaginibacter sp. TaxID=1882438 RepID=UPI0032663D2E